MEIATELLLPFIVLSGAFMLCIFCMLLARFGQLKTSSWILLVFLGIAMYAFGAIGYTSQHINKNVLVALGTNPAAFFLIPVGLYFFLLDIFGKKLKTSIRLLHFIPFLTFYLIFNFVQHPLPPHIAQKTNNPIMFIYIIVLLIMIVFYLVLIIRALRFHQKDYINQFASDSTYITLRWFNTLIFFVISMAGIFVISSFFSFNETMITLQLGIKAFAFLFMLMGFAFFGLQQPVLYKIETILKNQTESDQNTNNSIVGFTDTKKQIPKDQLKKYADLLEEEMVSNKPYLNKQIRLSHLANTINIPAHILSTTINQYYSLNFFQYINSYRIKYACKLLTNSDYENFTLEAIAEEAGFNSKSTFNTRFKEVMHMTPNQYKQQR